MEYKEALVAVGIRVSGSLKPTWALLGGKNPPKQTNKQNQKRKQRKGSDDFSIDGCSCQFLAHSPNLRLGCET